MQSRRERWIHSIVLLVTLLGTILSVRGLHTAESNAAKGLMLILALGNPVIAVQAGRRLWRMSRSRAGSIDP
ncbi:hypothetical protein MK489_18870 [Myxococcota bacterium]|nr:hypothetical protein [Myxococcota bacterium]